MKYKNLLTEKDKLEDILDGKSPTDEHQQLLQLKYKTYQLEQENKELRQKLHIDTEDHHRSAPESPKVVDKSFREQIPVSDDHYKIPIAIRNKVAGPGGSNARIILNSVENFQIIQNNEQSQNVLQQPVPLNSKSTTTTTTPTSIIKKENLVTPQKALLPSTAKTYARVKPLPKGKKGGGEEDDVPLTFSALFFRRSSNPGTEKRHRRKFQTCSKRRRESVARRDVGKATEHRGR